MQNGMFNQITGRRAPPTWQAEILRLQVAAPGLIKPKKGSFSTLIVPHYPVKGEGVTAVPLFMWTPQQEGSRIYHGQGSPASQ